jgi:hypothetical protein
LLRPLPGDCHAPDGAGEISAAELTARYRFKIRVELYRERLDWSRTCLVVWDYPSRYSVLATARDRPSGLRGHDPAYPSIEMDIDKATGKVDAYHGK